MMHLQQTQQRQSLQGNVHAVALLRAVVCQLIQSRYHHTTPVPVPNKTRLFK